MDFRNLNDWNCVTKQCTFYCCPNISLAFVITDIVGNEEWFHEFMPQRAFFFFAYFSLQLD
jgi:hypothetical protein